jgi:hypothetical protein
MLPSVSAECVKLIAEFVLGTEATPRECAGRPDRAVSMVALAWTWPDILDLVLPPPAPAPSPLSETEDLAPPLSVAAVKAHRREFDP